MGDHKFEEMKGRVKEAAGDLTDDEGLQREGKVDQASAKIKDVGDDAKDAIIDVVNPDDDDDNDEDVS